MKAFVLAHEPQLRLILFAGILSLMALWEVLAPRRVRGQSRWLRWSNNLGLVVLNTLLVRLLIPVLAVEMALRAESAGWGLLNQGGLPYGVGVILAVVALDLVIYLQHVLFHAVPLLWRLHRLHHADTDFDVTTGSRFHPVEILLSMGIKLAAVSALGAPPEAVVLFEILLNGTAMFNHANVRLPLGVDRVLRQWVVTPDMHRVHHSVRPEETNSNFGFNLPWWDRLFGTYRAQPREGHEGMTIGLDILREAREQWLPRLLIQPWQNMGRAYDLTRAGNSAADAISRKDKR
ncbi:MAG: sterol desaturase family protein [Deltaproteobacteria bacterium]|nr:sterol desaturase family protein [Deltaproteobacteria bacterium]